MRWKKIEIENIQTLKGKHTMELDLKKNRISGNNNKGKTSLNKPLKLFFGPTHDELRNALITKGEKKASISITLENDYIMTCEFTHKTLLYTCTAPNGTVYKQWDLFSSEIPRMMNLFSLKESQYHLNLKNSKVNLFLDTTPRVNGELVELIVQNKDLQMRIYNIEQKTEEVKGKIKQVTFDKNKAENRYYSLRKLDKTKFTNGRNALAFSIQQNNKNNYLLNVLSNLNKQQSVRDNIKEVNELVEQYKKVSNITKILIILSWINKRQTLKETINEIEKIQPLNSNLLKIKLINQVLSSKVICNTNKIIIDNISDIELINKDLIKFKLINDILFLKRQQDSRVDTIHNIDECKNMLPNIKYQENLETMISLLNNKISISNNVVSNLKLDKNKFNLIQNIVYPVGKTLLIINENKKLLEKPDYFGILSNYLKRYNIRTELAVIQNKLSYYNECPLCGSSLKGDSHGTCKES